MKKKQPTIGKLREICGRIEPYRDAEGRVRLCSHLTEKGLCDLPDNFNCVVKETMRRKNAENHTSQSRIGSFLSCPLAWKYSYIDGLRPKEAPAWQYLGTEFHKHRANIEYGLAWKLADIPPNSLATPVDKIKLEEVLKWYEKNMKMFPVAEECEVDIQIHTPAGKLIIGQVDGLSREAGKGEIIHEWKYTVMKYDSLMERRQVCFYFAGRPNAVEVEILSMKKPLIKPKKGETLNAFRARCAETIKKYAEEGKMVDRRTYQRDQFPIEEELVAADAVHKMIDACTEAGCFPGAYGPFSCPGCKHRNHCKRMTIS